MLYVYTRTCAPCNYRVQLSRIKAFASSMQADVKVVETLSRSDLEEEAKMASNLPLPFVYNTRTGLSMRLKDVKEGFIL